MKIPFFSEIVLDRVFTPKKLGCEYPFIMIDSIPVEFNSNPIVYSIAAVLFSLNPEDQPVQERLHPNNFVHYRLDMGGQIPASNKSDVSVVKLVENNISVAAVRESGMLPVTPIKEGVEGIRNFIEKYRAVNEGVGIVTPCYKNGGPVVDNVLGGYLSKSAAAGSFKVLSFEEAITNLLPEEAFPTYIPDNEWFTPTALGNCLNNIRRLQLAYLIQEKTLWRD